jgi:hypothetical protein
MKLKTLLPALLLLISLVGTAYAKADIPHQLFINAEVAVQLKENKHLTEEIHHLRLGCFEGRCQINTTVLNRCAIVGDDRFQSPFSFIEKSSDKGTSFKIDGNTITAVVESNSFDGKSLSRYHFVLGEPLIQDQIIEFTGGYVKSSNITNSLIKVEFIPLKQKYQHIKLACPIELPGIG